MKNLKKKKAASVSSRGASVVSGAVLAEVVAAWVSKVDEPARDIADTPEVADFVSSLSSMTDRQRTSVLSFFKFVVEFMSHRA